jgi:hypothetical protein
MTRPRQYGQRGLSSLKALALAFALLFTAAEASANDCPIISTAKVGPAGAYRLDVDSTCLTSEGVSTTTLSCAAMPGYSFDVLARSHTIWSFVVPPYTWYSHWAATAYVDFDSPTHTIYDALYGYIRVLHYDGTTYTNTVYTFFHLQGNSATSNSCVRYDKSINVTAGDTITVEFDGYSAFDGGTIKASVPIIWNEYP